MSALLWLSAAFAIEDCTVFTSRAVWSAPHCTCSWDRTTVRPASRGPRCSGAHSPRAGATTPCHILNQGCHCSVPNSQTSVPTLSHQSTKAYHYKKSLTHKDKHKERNKGLTKQSESKEQYGDKLLSINNYSKCK